MRVCVVSIRRRADDQCTVRSCRESGHRNMSRRHAPHRQRTLLPISTVSLSIYSLLLPMRTHGRPLSFAHVLSCFLSFYNACIARNADHRKARGYLSVRPSRSDVFQRMKIRSCGFQRSGRTITIVSGEVTFIRIFAADHPSDWR